MDKGRGETRGPLQRCLLKKTAVPSVWPNCPKYLTKAQPLPRPEIALASTRRQIEVDEVEEQAMSFLEEDQVSSITDVMQKLQSSALPMNVHFSKQDDKLVLYSFDITSEGRAVVKFSLTIFRIFHLPCLHMR